MTFRIRTALVATDIGEPERGGDSDAGVGRARYSLLFWALLLSAAAHVMLLSKLPLGHPPGAAEAYRLSLRLQRDVSAVRVPSPAQSQAAVAAVGAGRFGPPAGSGIGPESRSAAPATPGPGGPPPALQRLPRALDLSLPPPATAPAERQAARGTVFDERLRDRLSVLRAQRSARSPTAPVIDEVAVTVDGGRVSRFYKVGNDCFRVVEADPLDAFGVDRWYMERCP